VNDLLDDVKLAKAVVLEDFARERFQRGAMFFPHVLDVAQPVVDQTELLPAQRREHAAAAVVAADDDMLDVQHIHGELDHRQAVEIGVHDDVRHVAVHEQVAGHQPDDFVRGHAAVGAADPEIRRRLLL
jgi:hypothetical protein